MINLLKKKISNELNKSELLVVKITKNIIYKSYLFVIFRINIFGTFIYLYKNGYRRKKLPLKLISRNNLKFPEMGSPIINPSIVFEGNKLKGAARMTNAGIEPLCDYRGMPVQLYRRNGENLRNGIITFTTNLEGDISELEIRHSLSEIPNFEDPRIFTYANQTFLIMTNVQSPIGNERAPWQSCIVIENLENREIYNLTSPTRRGIEKNWIPIESKTNIKILYSTSPVTILTFEPLTRLMSYEISDISSPVSLNNRTQMIATSHPSIPYIRIASKKYAHRKVGYTPFHYFEILSKNLESTKLSKPFVFSSIQMEICQGLTLKDNLLILSWTERDKISKIGSINVESVLELF